MSSRGDPSSRVVLGHARSARQLSVAFWTEGPAGADGRPVLVSVTDFFVPRTRDLLLAWAEGLRLRRSRPSMPGAIGLWLWAKPLSSRSGSVSVCCGEDDLRCFVGWQRHVKTMRRFRGVGQLNSASWWAERFDASEIWETAERRLLGDDPELAHPAFER
jgi:hypothetical protein